jgi:DNA-binding XRE family transcriptional regulator
MTKKEFAQIRQYLSKTQKEMAQLLGVSIRTIQSFEQGLRRIPVYTERQTLLLLSLKNSRSGKKRLCWVEKECPMKVRRGCPAWEFNAGNLCWFINGTLCEGKVQKSWRQKLEICKKCGVFHSLHSLN